MVKTYAQLTDRVSQILEDTGNAIFEDAAQIQPQLDDCLREISNIKPFEVRHTKTLTSSTKLGETLSGNTGREIDVSDLDNLLNIKYIQYPVDSYPIQRVDFTQYFNTVFLNLDTRASAGEQQNASGDTQLLTGIVTFTSGSNAITGSGTLFTKELEVGYYIAKSGSSNWYRVASISSDTALKVSINVATADDGADSSGATRYWYEYAYLYCNKNHYVEATQTDLAGAIDSGSASGYAEDTYVIHIDGLGTGTMPKDMFLTIAGVEGIYRIKEAATIATNECDITIEPRLKGRAEEDAVVTFYGSSLTPELENILCDLTAGRVALNWVGDARTAADSAVTTIDLASDAVDLMTARIAAVVTDISTLETAATANFTLATTALSKATTLLATDAEAALDSLSGDFEAIIGADGVTVTNVITLASAEIDDALTDTQAARTSLETTNATAINNALAAILAELSQSIDDVDSARTYTNVVPRYGTPDTSKLNAATLQLSIVAGKVREIQALMSETTIYNPLITAELQSARSYLAEANALMTAENQLLNESALESRERIRLAMADINEAKGHLEADARKVANLRQVMEAELRAAQFDLHQSGGYFREAAMTLRAANTYVSLTKWANEKIKDALSRLYRMQPSVVVCR